MKTYYFRIEAVNLDFSVYDTHDISTIRGGSFMLQDAFSSIDLNEGEFEDVGSAASIGLYKLKLPENADPELTAQNIMEKLKKATAHFGTFVYAIQPKATGKSFSQQVQELTAKCRWMQYQSPSFVLPEEKNKDEFCQFDGLRPAVGKIQKGSEPQRASKAVITRHDKGKKLRNRLYEELLGEKIAEFSSIIEPESPFTDDLETLTKNPAAGKLDGKMAFIYIDGNRFGNTRDRLCSTEKLYKQFQGKIQEELRKPAFKNIIDFSLKPENASFLIKNDDNDKYRIRMETLLWGGDEIEWVVPAWQVMNVLQIFYDSVTQYDRYEGVKLTHSAGVVFCHHNLPILQVRKYARKLCDIAKSNVPKDIYKIKNEANCFAFLNMTSFDLITGGMQDFLTEYYAPAAIKDFVIPAQEIQKLQEYLPVLEKHFPRNKLHDIVLALRDSKTDKICIILDRVKNIVGGSKWIKIEKAMDIIIEGNSKRWFVIADLLNYVGE